MARHADPVPARRRWWHALIPKRRRPDRPQPGIDCVGVASWYAHDNHLRRMADPAWSAPRPAWDDPTVTLPAIARRAADERPLLTPGQESRANPPRY